MLRKLSQDRSKWLMALPTIALLLLFSLYPLFSMLHMSFTRSTLGQPFRAWVGLQNYKDALVDRIFMTSIGNTLIFGFGVTIAELIIGFLLALFFYRSVQAGRYLRTLALLPFIAPPVAVAMIWRLIYEPNVGLINHYLRQWNITQQSIPFLGQPETSLLSIMVIDIWQWTPFVFILALAALQSLPEEPYEAAAVDGATPFEVFRFITLPMMIPSLLVIGIIRLIGAFKVFDQVYMLTGGGPGISSQVATHYIYRTAFNSFNIGYASSMTIILLVIVIVVITALTLLHAYTVRRYD
ncbi:MAG: sugar ABC transporter permease [Aggregatilineales bacterium]